MLNIRRILVLAMVCCLASGMSFAYTNFGEVPANTEPYSTDQPPWQPPPAPNGGCTFFTLESEFTDHCGVLKSEDFSSSTAEPGGVCSGISPLDSNTNDGCFNGTLNEGITFLAIGIGEYAAVGTWTIGRGHRGRNRGVTRWNWTTTTSARRNNASIVFPIYRATTASATSGPTSPSAACPTTK